MKTKRINSKAKGDRAEREIAKILTEHFGVPFARVGVTSGARPKQVKLDGHAKKAYTGDLILPDGFRFSIEAKSVNIDVDFFDESAAFERWLSQATEDAESIGKLPMLCWKVAYKGWLVALPIFAFTNYGSYGTYYVRYANNTERWRWGWIIKRLDALLEANQEWEFWFDQFAVRKLNH